MAARQLMNQYDINYWVMHPVARVLIIYFEDLRTQQIL
jgi:hypothetical protein